MPNLAADLLLVVAVVYDWRTRGRVHPTYTLAGGLLFALQIIRIPLSGTSAWQAINELAANDRDVTLQTAG